MAGNYGVVGVEWLEDKREEGVMERRSHKTLRAMFGLIALVTLFQLGGCAIMYSSADVEGRIVDAESGEPIEGAVVVGVWQLESQGFEHSYGAAIHVVESVSDTEGHYRLKGFGTKWVGPFRGELRNSDPWVVVFAEGYMPGNAGSYTLIPLKHSTGHHRVSPYNGRDIKLERAALDDWSGGYAWDGKIRQLLSAGDCWTTELPEFKSLIERVERQYSRPFNDISGVYGQTNTRSEEFAKAEKQYQMAAEDYLDAVRRYKDAAKRCKQGGRAW